jgi:hypothetical protein
MRRRGNESFYGDSGTVFNEQTRDEIEKNAGAGHPGNSVDFAQRYAQSEADEYTEQAEQMTRSMERDRVPLGIPREQFVEQLAERLRGKPAMPTQPQEEAEEPSISRSADDKLWGSTEELKRAGKMVRPAKL